MRCIEDTRRVEGQSSGNFSRQRAIGWGRELLSGFGPRRELLSGFGLRRDLLSGFGLRTDMWGQ